MGRRHAHPGKPKWVAVNRVPLTVGSIVLILARGSVWCDEPFRAERFQTKGEAQAVMRAQGGTGVMKAADAEAMMRTEREGRRALRVAILEQAVLA